MSVCLESRSDLTHLTLHQCEDVVNEWYVTRGNAGERPDPVPATPLDWQVPTLERLWFGSDVEDGQRRLRAFLSCMKVD
jgi:hypothetical protein